MLYCITSCNIFFPLIGSSPYFYTVMASEFDDNEEIFRNVSELKRRLYQTEVSLQKLQAPR